MQVSPFVYPIYSPLGYFIRSFKSAKELDARGKSKLRERESKKYGGPVVLSKPTSETIAKYEQIIKFN